MHWILVSLCTLSVALLAGLGIAAMTTGWLPSWGGRVLRPRLWGSGAVVGAVGMSLFMFLGPLRGPDLDMAPYVMSGLVLFFVGQALQWAGKRPGRPAQPMTTDPG
jgi:hypothetical protein